MPLSKGKSKKSRDKNIKQLISEGYDPNRAVAIAYKHKRNNKRQKEK